MIKIKQYFIDLLGEKVYDFIIHLLIATAVIFIGLILIKIIINILKKWLKKGKIDETMHPFIINSIRILCMVFLIMTVLPIINIPVASFVATIGAAGVAVALALQNSLSNLAGGIIILITKPFLKGDFIDDLTVSGTVEEINMLCSTLITPDNKTITIPNGQLANSRIINYTKQELRRLDLIFSISYNDDISKAKSVLKRIVNDHPLCLETPEYIIGVNSHNASSVDIDLKVWVKKDDYFTVSYDIKEQVKNAFDKEKISIPFPQIDVNINQ